MNKTDPIRHHVLEFIRQKRVGVIATESKHVPHAATVFFLVHDDFSLYFVTTQQTKKIQDITKNEHVAIVFGAEDSPDTVQIEGVAEVLEGEKSLSVIAEVTKIASSVNYHWPPVARLSSDQLVAVQITPEWIRWLDLRPLEKSPSVSEEELKLQYTQILP